MWGWIGDAGDDLGDPVGGDTRYALCVYDTRRGDPVAAQLVMSTVIPPGRGWRMGADKLLAFIDCTGSNGGIKLIGITAPGVAPRKIVVEGSDDRLVLPPPAGGLLLAQNPRVSVQLVNSSGGCWQGVYDTPAMVSTPRLFWDIN